MSAYMVDYETINRVITTIKKEKKRIDGYYNEQFSFHYPALADIMKHPKPFNNLGKRLLELNLNSLYSRYTNPIESYDDYIAKYKFEEDKGSQIQEVKSINCFLSQCAYGTNPYSQLFKELELLMGNLAKRILEGMEEYQNTEWK